MRIDRAGDRADVVAAATEDRRSADRHGDGGREEILVADVDERLAEEAEQQHPGQRRADRRDHVRDDEHPADVDAGEKRGRRVRADRIELAAERR